MHNKKGIIAVAGYVMQTLLYAVMVDAIDQFSLYSCC